jgi:hypothetical protein
VIADILFPRFENDEHLIALGLAKVTIDKVIASSVGCFQYRSSAFLGTILNATTSRLYARRSTSLHYQFLKSSMLCPADSQFPSDPKCMGRALPYFP